MFEYIMIFDLIHIEFHYHTPQLKISSYAQEYPYLFSGSSNLASSEYKASFHYEKSEYKRNALPDAKIFRKIYRIVQ